MESKNALAELAERLDGIADVFRSENTTRFEDICKTKRIVTELAKVKDCAVKAAFTRAIINIPNEEQCISAVKNCRAIAEEGEKNAREE